MVKARARAPIFGQHSHPKVPVTVVGAVFRPEQVGFAAPLGSPPSPMCETE
jgi:hypothetical protein